MVRFKGKALNYKPYDDAYEPENAAAKMRQFEWHAYELLQ